MRTQRSKFVSGGRPVGGGGGGGGGGGVPLKPVFKEGMNN